MEALRELINKTGVTFDADKLTILFAEDWANIRNNFITLSSYLTLLNYLTIESVEDNMPFGISFSQLDYVTVLTNAKRQTSNELVINLNPNLTLIQYTVLLTISTYMQIQENNNLTSISLYNVSGCPVISINWNPLLSELDISGLSSLENMQCGNNVELSDLTLNNVLNCENVNFNNCNLSEASVDRVLFVLSEGTEDNGYCNLADGTNAVPSVLGLGYQAILEGRGWTVIVNS